MVRLAIVLVSWVLTSGVAGMGYKGKKTTPAGGPL
jgi:hypothetical protein